MDDDALAAALAEVGGVLHAVGIGGNRATVLACDAAVHVARRVGTVGEVVLAGGGSTDMLIGIDAALDVPDPPTIVIVLTDGYTPWPERAPARARVITGLTGDATEGPPWITTIHIPPA